MVTKLVIAGFLAAHAAIHASFLSPAPPATATGPAWPFALDRSALLSPLAVDAAILRLVGTGLVAGVIAAFWVAAVAVLGVGPRDLFEPAVIVGAAASIALLVLYFNVWFVLGIAIDLVILWTALGDWTPESIAG